MNFKKPLIRCENFIPFVQLLNIYANIFSLVLEEILHLMACKCKLDYSLSMTTV